MKSSYRERHYNAGSILLGFGVLEAVGGCLNTWIRTGQLFPGPHLFGGAGAFPHLLPYVLLFPYLLVYTLSSLGASLYSECFKNTPKNPSSKQILVIDLSSKYQEVTSFFFKTEVYMFEIHEVEV